MSSNFSWSLPSLGLKDSIYNLANLSKTHFSVFFIFYFINPCLAFKKKEREREERKRNILKRKGGKTIEENTHAGMHEHTYTYPQKFAHTCAHTHTL